MARRPLTIAAAAVLVAGCAAAWYAWRASDAQQIRSRLNALAGEFNASTTDGIGTVARAARLGSFFTQDVVVDFGQGTAPITGRETLMGMAARLQPRTAAFTLALDDINVEVGGDTADVTLTAEFKRRSFETGDESLDAREFSAGMRRADGEWRIARVTAVDTLR